MFFFKWGKEWWKWSGGFTRCRWSEVQFFWHQHVGVWKLQQCDLKMTEIQNDWQCRRSKSHGALEEKMQKSTTTVILIVAIIIYRLKMCLKRAIILKDCRTNIPHHSAVALRIPRDKHKSSLHYRDSPGAGNRQSGKSSMTCLKNFCNHLNSKFLKQYIKKQQWQQNHVAMSGPLIMTDQFQNLRRIPSDVLPRNRTSNI